MMIPKNIRPYSILADLTLALLVSSQSLSAQSVATQNPTTQDLMAQSGTKEVPAPQSPQSQQRSEVLLETTEGNIRVALYDETPLHRDNFLKLVGEHVYDSLLFHRVIKDFMIQGGDPKSRHAKAGESLGEGDLGYTIEAEFRLPRLYHRRGALAAAREGDRENPERRSSSCQFYIVWGRNYTQRAIEYQQFKLDEQTNGRVQLSPEMMADYVAHGGAPWLDGQYTVFGEVVEGLDVVERIQQTATDEGDRPLQDIRILRATIVQPKSLDEP